MNSAESDKKGVSPGSEVLKNLFDAAAPCLILMDELVAYAKKIYGASGLPAGTFDNFISFIQEVTEAARASKNSLVVASIPESDIEIGGEAGKPGSIPLDVPNVRDELTRHLSEGWTALVDREVDGRNPIPFQKDQSNPRYGGRLAARRVARTVMLGSAPTVRGQNVRGIEASRIRLGVINPAKISLTSTTR